MWPGAFMRDVSEVADETPLAEILSQIIVTGSSGTVQTWRIFTRVG
ncbi:hypothetical protein NG2371_05947 [Nocardia gamkensis]|nr:hypothetical protein [Nocardia gamkensis]